MYSSVATNYIVLTIEYSHCQFHKHRKISSLGNCLNSIFQIINIHYNESSSNVNVVR